MPFTYDGLSLLDINAQMLEIITILLVITHALSLSIVRMYAYPFEGVGFYCLLGSFM